MKASISLEKERIQLKEEGKKVIVPINPSEGKPWEEPDDANDGIQRLYEIVQNNEDTVEPNNYGELHLGRPISVGYNSDSKVYGWKMANYEAKA